MDIKSLWNNKIYPAWFSANEKLAIKLSNLTTDLYKRVRLVIETDPAIKANLPEKRISLSSRHVLIIEIILLLGLINISFCGDTDPKIFTTKNFYGTAVKVFCGYACSDDCSGHIEGFKWAKRKGINSPERCGGQSQSFVEGCKAYATNEGADCDLLSHERMK